MKIKTVPTTRLALFCTALVAAWFMLSDRASAVSIREARELGLVQFGASSRHNDGSTYINNLIGMALRSNEMANRQYLRSDNLTPHAVLIDHMNRGHALGSRERIMVPVPGGVPKPSSGVPDGGITAMLLGAALGALGIAKRYLRT
jgi:hypothetical protein